MRAWRTQSSGVPGERVFARSSLAFMIRTRWSVGVVVDGRADEEVRSQMSDVIFLFCFGFVVGGGRTRQVARQAAVQKPAALSCPQNTSIHIRP